MFTTTSAIKLDLLSPAAIKQYLLDSIDELAQNIDKFSANPGHSFTRNTKLGLSGLIYHLICMGSKDTRGEIADLIPLDEQAYTDSAVTMARKKLTVEGMEFLFHTFTDKLRTAMRINGYELCDVDGTDLNIHLNPDDLETYISQKNKSGYNQLHINVAYDPLTGIVRDIEIDTQRKKNESGAFLKMLKRWITENHRNRIFICDRGYISYNLIDTLNQSGAKYILRSKDITGKCMFSRMTFEEGEFDIDVKRILTRKHTKEYLENRDVYAVLESNVNFDFPEGVTEYPLSFRLVRIKLSTGEYELLVTNLPRSEFSAEDLKAVYNLRWPIEISNKQVKYDINLVDLHSRKQAYIRQEIYARYILLNFTNAIVFAASQVLRRIDYTKRTEFSEIRNIMDRLLRGEDVPTASPPSFAQYSDEPMVCGSRTNTKTALPVYKIDFSVAATTVKQFLKSQVTGDEMIISRIIKFLVLIKPGRSYDRDVKPQSNRRFSYRGC